MRISEDSWHFRLIGFMDFNHPRNLCAYCWKTVWAVLLGILFSAGLVTFFGGPIWYWLNPEYPFALAVVAGVAEVALVCFFIYQYLDYKGWIPTLPEREPRAPKPPGLIKSWLKAKHDKICPLLEFY